jgi:predicted nucleotidyltransferase component of viral defense system
MERAVEVDYHGIPLRIMDAEDFVLRKLVNCRKRRNPNDLDDAYQVLLHAWMEIDAERLVARASGHRVEKLARELVDLAREDRARLERGEQIE